MDLVQSSNVRATVMSSLAERLAARDMTEAIAAALRENLPAYRAIPADLFRTRVKPVTRDNVELLLRVLRQGAPVRDPELERFRRSAADRAAEGMALGDVLGAYRIGGRVVYRQLVTIYQRGEEPELLKATDLLMQYVDQVSSAVAEAYVEEFKHVVSEGERDLRALFDSFCRSRPVPADLHARADSFGLVDGAEVHPVVVIAGEADVRAHSDLAARLREHGILAISEGRHVVGLSVPSPRPLLPDDEAHLATYSRPTPASELIAALGALRDAAALGHRLGRRGVLPLSELFPEVLLAASPKTVETLKQDLLEPMRANGRRNAADLIGTVRTYLEHDLSRAATANALHIHVNTLDHRLGRIAALTGIDLTTTDGIVRAALALSSEALPADRN